ncbi:MAG: hypothetical protein GY710_19665 [Desulfobacteraceae bacterium]|nr:hypothetical protein [Desulfobacteraceae bacterium]
MSGNNNKTHLENNGKMPIQDGAMMKKMIESGVALKLFRPQLYPSMTVVHDPTQESLNTFEQLSLKRMLRGYELLSESMNQISMAVTSKDLPKIRKTQEQLRTGYEQLTSGISTYLKLTDKESAHEIGLNWFKQELNIDYSSPFHPQDILWGMDAKRLIMCIIMLSGFILAIIAYAYRMGRVKALFQKISTGDSVKSSPIKSDPVKSDNNITVKIE